MADAFAKPIRQLQRDGFTVLRRFLSPAEVKRAVRAMHEYVPTKQEWLASPMKYRAIVEEEPLHKLEFPYAERALNDVATHPKLLAFVERLLGTADIALARSAVWAKYAGTSDYDQEMHADFEGNTLVVPRDDGDYRQVNIIIYYSDVDARHGPTMVVPGSHTPEHSLQPPRRYRLQFPDAYKGEKPVLAKAGDMLVFSMRTLHRGSAIRAEDGVRFTHHLVYRAARHRFQGHRCWASYGEYSEMQAFIERASPRQREVLGFPKPGDPYWNEQTIREVGERYPRMDMRPYVKGMRT